MNRTVFEGRYLVDLVGSVIKQKDFTKKYMKMDWERLFHLADYHKIANIIYIGMLGASEHVPKKWGERFFERYQESLMYSSSYENSELEILTMLNMHKISATVLESSATRRLYRIPESASNSPLRILMSEKDYSLAKGFLIDLGYLTDHFYPKFGEHMRAGNGFTVEIYYKLPFITKNYQKCMTSLMEKAYIDKTFNSMHTFSLESSFVFRMAEICYNYCEDALTIRKLLDVFLFYHQFRSKMNQDLIWTRFKEFKIDVIAECLIHISSIWFGNRADDMPELTIEDADVYDNMESRILSNGVIGTDMVNQASILRNEIQRELDKEKKIEEKALRKQERGEFWHRFKQELLWIFPEYKYMSSLYPTLEKLPVLLPFFWIIRGLRMMKEMMGFGSRKKRDASKEVSYGSTKKAESSGGISYLPRETKTTKAIKEESMSGVAVSLDDGGRSGKIYDSVQADKEQKSRLDEEIKSSVGENVTEADFRMDENAETSIGLWEFPKLKNVQEAASQVQNKAAAEKSRIEKPEEYEGNDLLGMDVSLFNNILSNDKNRTSDKVTIVPEYTDSGKLEYSFKKEGESSKTERSQEPEIVVAQDENHNSIGVQKWHFPTLEEVEEKEKNS
ncbi:nucleotidyltransferase family protein [Oribacterium sp. FC2011]|uniref:nucleotidyltransferase family protein n=1 Tax=Oribacterium sp. FC2011 TaxID=1408311 RepID=UPI000678E226|nr:nucleotidyltransferase family protein [Oribacterium sp. FC2011]